MKLWQPIDLPPIPERFTCNEDWNNPDHPPVDDIGYGLDHHQNGQRLEPASYHPIPIKYRPLQEWLLRNIRGVTEQQLYILSLTILLTGRILFILDIKRHCALNYIIDTGGDNVVTSWYQEKNKPLRRGLKTKDYQTDTGHVLYDDLTLLDSTVFEKGKWYLLSTDVLHDVQNICGERTIVTVDYNNFFTRYLWDKIFEA